MRIAVTQLDKTIQLMALSDEGQPVDGLMTELHQGERFGPISFEHLRQCETGEYELYLDPHEICVRENTQESLPVKWWELLGIGLFVAVMAPLAWWWLGDFEENGGSIKIHWIVAIVYSILGKEGVAAAFGLVGFAFIGTGLLRASRKDWHAIGQVPASIVRGGKPTLVRGMLVHTSGGRDLLAPAITPGGGFLVLTHPNIPMDDLHLRPVEVAGKFDPANPNVFQVTEIRPLSSEHRLTKD